MRYDGCATKKTKHDGRHHTGNREMNRETTLLKAIPGIFNSSQNLCHLAATLAGKYGIGNGTQLRVHQIWKRCSNHK